MICHFLVALFTWANLLFSSNRGTVCSMVLGVLAGTMGILQASEAIKEILGIGETLADRLLIYDALEMKFRKVGRPKDPACPLCGAAPAIKDLRGDYAVTCSI